MDVSPERFAELVEKAFAAIPAELTAQLDNVALFIEDEPPPDDPGLLGWYDGIALTERDTAYGGVLPDRIVVVRSSILAICDSEDDVVREIGITVAHEIAHHFGIDDERLHALGYA
ncbi:MAG: metallopeptidase family protein [Aeromicrobium sp.]